MIRQEALLPNDANENKISSRYVGKGLGARAYLSLVSFGGPGGARASSCLVSSRKRFERSSAKPLQRKERQLVTVWVFGDHAHGALSPGLSPTAFAGGDSRYGRGLPPNRHEPTVPDFVRMAFLWMASPTRQRCNLEDADRCSLSFSAFQAFSWGFALGRSPLAPNLPALAKPNPL